MRILTLIIFVLALGANVHAGWNWVSGGGFNDMEVVPGGEIWLGGEVLVHGLKLDNGTWNWTQKGTEITGSNPVTSISFYDSSHGMALTRESLYYTGNGGASWTRRPLPSLYEILDVYMVNDESAYACGSETREGGQGVILKTTDGGKNWSLLFKTNIYYGGAFTQIKMFSASHGIATGTFHDGWGSFGALFRTENDWNTAGKALELSEYDLWGFSAPTETDIFVRGGDVTHDPYLGYTHNGDNWIQVRLDQDIVRIDGISFDSAQHGYAVGYFDNNQDPLYREYGAVVLETSDGGVTWNRTNFGPGQSILEERDMDSTALVTLHFVAIAKGDVFIGQRYSKVFPCADQVCTGKILMKEKDASEWRLVDRLSGYRYTRANISHNLEGTRIIMTGFDIFKNQSFARKILDDFLYSPHFFEYTCNFTDFDMFSQTEGWGAYCRDQGYKTFYLLRTRDGGDTWARVETNISENIFLADSIGVKANSAGQPLVFYRDGAGDHILRDVFTTPRSMDGRGISSINFLGNGRICYRPNICLDDAGNVSYLSIGNDSASDFLKLQFVNDRTAFALRRFDKALFRSLDGGSTWSLSGKAEPGDITNFDIRFVDEQHGYLRDKNLIKYTDDGGATWKSLPLGASPDYFLGLSAEGILRKVAYSPSGMIIEDLEQEGSYEKDWCGSYDPESATLYVPCLSFAGNDYVLLFETRTLSPVTIELEDAGLLSGTGHSSRCATFDPGSGTFHIPCVDVVGTRYGLDFILTSPAPIQFELVNGAPAQ